MSISVPPSNLHSDLFRTVLGQTTVRGRASPALTTKGIVGVAVGVAMSVVAVTAVVIWVWRSLKRSERAAQLDAVEVALSQVPEPFFNSGEIEAPRMPTKGRPIPIGRQPMGENRVGPALIPRASAEPGGGAGPVGSDSPHSPLLDWVEDETAPPEYTSERARPATEEDTERS